MSTTGQLWGPRSVIRASRSDLERLSAGQRRFMELVIVCTWLLYLPVWLGCTVWWGLERLTGGQPGPQPDFIYLRSPGCLLYVPGAWLAVTTALFTITAMCVLPVMVLSWAVQGWAAGGPPSEVAARAGAGLALESLLVWLYRRHVSGALNG
ncbi:hypothetical protein [Deinococcus sonorensis]|uniref:Transmembrane protein n=2 Tax=Deinococcus sonorensis TaxID=309891 RepID=A0AAU7U5G2_9DEIO